MRKLWALALMVALPVLVACDPGTPALTPTPTPPQVVFKVTTVAVQPSGETLIELGVSNVGSTPIPADTFTADFELRGPGETLRASGTALLSPMSPSGGEMRPIIGWSGPLDAGAYDLSWGAPGLGSTFVEFEIVRANGDLRVGTQIVERSGPGYPRPDSVQGN